MRVWRVLDANANRAAEGLRVLEEVARFVREDPSGASMLKSLRHELAAAVSPLDRQQRLAARSTAHDPGAQLSTATEVSRDSIEALVCAEVQRVGEALRVLEEYAKLVDHHASQSLKQLRYRAYDQLAKLELAWTLHAWLKQLRLCILIDCAQPLDQFTAAVRQLAQAGARCLQVRDKRREGRELVEYSRLAVEVLREFDGHVIVNDRVDVALASGAAGVHVGQDDMAIEDVRRIAGQRLCVGVSTHNIQQARLAAEAGADYIGCGPTFPSQTKPFDQFAGVDFLRQVAAEIDIPCLAIGGIGLNNLAQVLDAGIRGVAVSAAVHQASQPATAVAELCQMLRN
ncbi:MAG: thiamine phosphate synthase [Pirellulaceae bacterium]|nr:thiamine phosphate synthase [Pirellulaceae bacterium]